jgi:(p)ppGpp synthase/HD superfamily hydrolase
VGSLFTQERYLRAARFAAEAHQRQTVPGTELPYLLHLTLVAMEVIVSLAEEPGVDGDLAVQCALLHDCIEDAGVSAEQVREEFGPAVAAGVDALSKREAVPKAERMADSLARIRQQPREVWRVKLADRICNLERPPHYWTKEKCRAYRMEAEEILAALGDASPYLAERLRKKIEAYRVHEG